MKLRTRILRVLATGPRARRVLRGLAAHHGKREEFDDTFAELFAAGAIRKLGGRKDATYGLPAK